MEGVVQQNTMFYSFDPFPKACANMEADAVAALTDADLKVNVRTESLPAYSPNDGRVISQSPTPDSEVDLGTRVTIVIGRAEDPNG